MKVAGCETLIGMAFENAPVPFSVPVRFVVQMIGADKLVAVSKVYPPFGVPPVPIRIRLPPETTETPSVGIFGITAVAVSCTLSKAA